MGLLSSDLLKVLRGEKCDSRLARVTEVAILEYYQTKVSREKKHTCLVMRLSVPFL